MIKTNKVIFDDSKQAWDDLTTELLKESGHIIVLRGAGSVNGADKNESDKLIKKELIPIIERYLGKGQVTIMYDGDPDDLENPDIGYFMGRIADRFKNENSISFIAVQKRSWYYPEEENGNLTNANGVQYITYVFEDGEYDGDHNAFTQDKKLVDFEKYEQWYIGASGDISAEQLRDFNNKISQGEKRCVFLFRVRNNQALDEKIRSKIDNAKEGEDVSKFIRQLKQRENFFGIHWNNDGTPKIEILNYENLNLSFVY